MYTETNLYDDSIKDLMSKEAAMAMIEDYIHAYVGEGSQDELFLPFNLKSSTAGSLEEFEEWSQNFTWEKDWY